VDIKFNKLSDFKTGKTGQLFPPLPHCSVSAKYPDWKWTPHTPSSGMAKDTAYTAWKMYATVGCIRRHWQRTYQRHSVDEYSFDMGLHKLTNGDILVIDLFHVAQRCAGRIKKFILSR
jgi:hypothetical protein